MTYLPSHFENENRAEIHDFLRSNPFATIVVSIDGSMWPSPIPLIYQPAESGWGSFIGHVAINNPMWRAEPESEVLVIVSGADTYITPNWYPTKADTHEVVPTWNYTAVHTWGTMQVHHDAKFKRMVVGKLTQIHERSSEVPWKMGDAPQNYLNGQLEHIVGIEISISKLKAKWKLNQNKPEHDRAGVIAGLEHRTSDADSAIREQMLRNHNHDEN